MSQTEQQPSLTTVYAGWDVYQQRFIEAFAPLTAEQLALRNSPEHWSVGMLIAHIVSTRVWWFRHGMGEGGPVLAPLELWDKGFQDDIQEPGRSAAELLSGLEQSWQMIHHLTYRDLAQVFPKLSRSISCGLHARWQNVVMTETVIKRKVVAKTGRERAFTYVF